MVEDGGDALLDAVHHQGVGGGPGAPQAELPVNGPPLAVQDLIEAFGVVALDGQAPGQGGIDVGMGVDEGGHDDAALRVQEFCLGVFGPQLRGGTDLQNAAALYDHAAVLDVAPGGVPGDESSVCQKIHGASSSPMARLASGPAAGSRQILFPSKAIIAPRREKVQSQI